MGLPLSLEPYETRRIDVTALVGKTIPKEAHWAAVILKTNSLPDEVMAVAASYDDALRYGAQTPFSDQMTFRWEGGHWEYDANHDSIITAGNGGLKPIKASFAIYYGRGTEKYEVEQTLQPDDQMWVDVGDLIRRQVPDKTGKTLPPDLSSGSYQFVDLTNQAVGSLFEGKVTYDKTFGHVSYGCASCCAYIGTPWFSPSPLGVLLQSGSQADVQANDGCDGYTSSVLSGFVSWSSANTTVATINPPSAWVKGVGTGSAIQSSPGDMTIGALDFKRCRVGHYTPSGPAKVQVCPTGVVINQTWSQPLQNDFPQFLTGVGILTSMKVGPVGTDFDTLPISETVTPTGNNCPASIQGATNFPTIVFSSFVVGNPAGWEGTNYPAISNAYYDAHTFKSSSNVLSGTNVSSCQSTATQTYSCNGIVIGSFSLTSNFQSGYIGTTPVTFVSISKQ